MQLSAMAKDTKASSLLSLDVCTDLCLGVCPCTKTNETQAFVTATKKRKLAEQATSGARKKKTCKDVARSWGCSTELMLYDDPWKIKKVLEKSDLGNLSRLLLGKELVEDLVLPVLGADDAALERGVEVRILDVDTNSLHSLIFKRWESSKSYVFVDKWVKDFVVRRGLKRGDEIGLHWDPYNDRFNFTVFHTYQG